jgi:hypothetical protein
MTPFAIAGIQMPVSASDENLSSMGGWLDDLMARYPWVQMVVFDNRFLDSLGPLVLPGRAPVAGRPLQQRAV